MKATSDNLKDVLSNKDTTFCGWLYAWDIPYRTVDRSWPRKIADYGIYSGKTDNSNRHNYGTYAINNRRLKLKSQDVDVFHKSEIWYNEKANRCVLVHDKEGYCRDGEYGVTNPQEVSDGGQYNGRSTDSIHVKKNNLLLRNETGAINAATLIHETYEDFDVNLYNVQKTYLCGWRDNVDYDFYFKMEERVLTMQYDSIMKQIEEAETRYQRMASMKKKIDETRKHYLDLQTETA